MIHKTKDTESGGKNAGRLEEAGAAAEQQMAFYMEREFGVSPGIHVLHDLRLELGGGDAVQIDHLVIHSHGMIIIESKSVSSEVTVDQRDEWTRRFGGREQGMPSPIKQAERQGQALRTLLSEHKRDLRDKRLMGMFQGGFESCPMETIVAISDRGVIRRHGGADPPEVKKADQVADKIKEIVARHQKAGSLVGMMRTAPEDNSGLYDLREGEIKRIIAFLQSRHRPRHSAPTRKSPTAPVPDPARPPFLAAPVSPKPPAPASTPPRQTAPAPPKPKTAPRPAPAPTPTGLVIQGHRCRHCASEAVLEVRWGKRAYYAVCATPECGKGTDLPKICPACGREARIRKQGPDFFRECPPAPEGCGEAKQIVAG